jgi:hypothetical protein
VQVGGEAGAEKAVGIVGGREAAEKDAFVKSVVMVYDKSRETLCSGSVISDSLVLTAAHCMASAASDLVIIFGTRFENSANPTRKVERFETAPPWPGPAEANSFYDWGDLALLKISGGLPRGYRPIARLDDSSKLGDQTPITIAGYGDSDGFEGAGSGVLRVAEMEIMDARYAISEIKFDQRSGKGACLGDSGGPAFLRTGETWVLAAVDSRNLEIEGQADRCRFASIYTKVTSYKTWIDEASARLNAKPKLRLGKIRERR